MDPLHFYLNKHPLNISVSFIFVSTVTTVKYRQGAQHGKDPVFPTLYLCLHGQKKVCLADLERHQGCSFSTHRFECRASVAPVSGILSHVTRRSAVTVPIMLRSMTAVIISLCS